MVRCSNPYFSPILLFFSVSRCPSSQNKRCFTMEEERPVARRAPFLMSFCFVCFDWFFFFFFLLVSLKISTTLPEREHHFCYLVGFYFIYFFLFLLMSVWKLLLPCLFKDPALPPSENPTPLKTITIGCARTTSWLPSKSAYMFLMEFWNFLREISVKTQGIS